MKEVTTFSNWIDHPKSLLSTDTGYKLRHISGRMVKSAEHETIFFVQDDGRLFEDGHDYEAQTGRIPAELVDVTEKLLQLWLEQQKRGDDFTNSYEAKQDARRDRYTYLSEKAQNEGHAAYQRANSIRIDPPDQPILIGHHSERRHRRTLERMDNLYRHAFVTCDGKAKHYESKAAAVGRGGISSDDPDATFKLLSKLQRCMKTQSSMKAANKLIRKHKKDPAAQLSALIELGFSEPLARQLLEGDFCNRIGFAPYQLQNNNAEIKRLQTRVRQLESVKSVVEPQRKEYDGFDLEIDPEENRILFYFSGKPDEKTRTLLKSRAFKWSRTRSAWVRKITPNALADARYVKKALLEASN